MITYNGLSGSIICVFFNCEESKSHYAEGTSFHIGKIKMAANNETYFDSPFHRYEACVKITMRVTSYLNFLSVDE